MFRVLVDSVSNRCPARPGPKWRIREHRRRPGRDESAGYWDGSKRRECISTDPLRHYMMVNITWSHIITSLFLKGLSLLLLQDRTLEWSCNSPSRYLRSLSTFIRTDHVRYWRGMHQRQDLVAWWGLQCDRGIMWPNNAWCLSREIQLCIGNLFL